MTSNKIEIAEAVETIFSVNVVKVNTLRVKGKDEETGPLSAGQDTGSGRRPIVTLKPGQSIRHLRGRVSGGPNASQTV